jgi:beta-glucosidase
MRAGDEVAQVYLDAPEVAGAARHELIGFQRVRLAPGGSRRVEFELSPRQLSTVDTAGVRAVAPGRYRVFIGGGQPGDAPGVAAELKIIGRRVLPK